MDLPLYLHQLASPPFIVALLFIGILMNSCFRVLLLLRSALLGIDISSLCGHSFALFMWVEKVSNDFGLHDNFYIHEIKLILYYACSVVEVALYQISKC